MKLGKSTKRPSDYQRRTMLSLALRPSNFGTFDQETWDTYKSRLQLSDDKALLEFYRQVVFDHFDHHIEHYPHFELDSYDFQIERLAAAEIKDKVRYFGNTIEEVASWGIQFDEFEAREKRGNQRRYRYIIYEEMSTNRTFPFPPVVLDTLGLADLGWRIYGRPLHLVEGTHRVGYLLRMLERGLIEPASLHDLVILRPKQVVDTVSSASSGT